MPLHAHIIQYCMCTQVPDITDYSMVNRTYRYFEGVPLFPFGYGLYVHFNFFVTFNKINSLCYRSYTTFKYSDLKIMPPTVKADQNVTVSVTVTNTGSRISDEVYIRHSNNIMHIAIQLDIII